MDKYRMDAAKALTPLMISKYIDANREKDIHLHHLLDYYLGRNDIMKRLMADPSKPNNKVVNPYASYITDTFVGYFMGDPVSYNCRDNEELLNRIQEIYLYNDEAATNSELAKDASIFGVAYELMYMDENADIRFKKLPPFGCIPIYDNTLEEDLLYFIRYYDEKDIITGSVKTYVEVYSRDTITYYVNELALEFVREAPHSFKAVPINIYENNEDELGDWENVISLIDAYDKITSDDINNLEYFADAYLVLTGCGGTDAEDIAAMKEQRVLLLDNDAAASWLTKTVNDGYIENLKTRIDAAIHKFSRCPAMTDADFAANASGVAMKYKLMGIENATSKKERAFKKALQRRLELICNIFSVMGTDYNYLTIGMVFTRNIPSNLVEMADVVSKIGTLLSDETKIGLLPIDTDAELEANRKEKELSASGLIYNFSSIGETDSSSTGETDGQ